MTRAYYPDDAISKFIDELRGKFSYQSIDDKSPAGSYTKIMATDVLNLRNAYEDPAKVDRIYAANQSVNEAKGIATDSIHQAIRNSEHVDRLEEKSSNLRDSANAFRQESKKVERHFCRQHWKMIGCIALIVLIILIIVVAVVAVQASD